MKSAALPPWTVSLADLALLLLACFVLLQAGSKREPAAGAGAAVAAAPAPGPLFDEAAAGLFTPGEARLTEAARSRLERIGRAAAGSRARLVIESIGRDPQQPRFDSWDLAAARTAAVARALVQGGLSEEDVAISMPGATGREESPGQRLLVRFGA